LEAKVGVEQNRRGLVISSILVRKQTLESEDAPIRMPVLDEQLPSQGESEAS
jgi:hypothetical protein